MKQKTDISETPGPDSLMASGKLLHQPPRILPCGDAAVTVEFGNVIDTDINARALGFDRAIAATNMAGIVETVPTYRSVTVHYDPMILNFNDISSALLEIAASSGMAQSSGRHWRIPVVYGGEFGMDLDFLAQSKNLTTEEVIRLHCAARYRVYMLGFMPGFSYLGGLDPALATPRRATPRQTSPSGSVSLGGEQAAVQCLSSPLGWHILGRTPVRTFHPTRKEMFLLDAGDTVSFFGIAAREWGALDRAAEAGAWVAELEPS